MASLPKPAPAFTFTPARQLCDALHLAAWDDLADTASEPNPFLERWFVEASACAPGLVDDVYFAVFGDGTQIDGLMPFSIAPKYGRLPIAHVTNHMHHNVFLGTPLVRAGMERDFWSALMPALNAQSWAKGLVRLVDLVEGGPLLAALEATYPQAETIHRHERAFLHSDLDAEGYYAATVRKKKRKEIKRLQSRLAELGEVHCDMVRDPARADEMCNSFMVLEQSGWKAVSGSPMGDTPATESFFRAMMHKGLAAGRIEVLHYSLAGKTLAMLVNFMTLPGSFSFKIAYDEDYARFSPGVLIQLENLKLLERESFGWMDSCAIPDHPMINSLWAERRGIIWKALPLSGLRHQMTYRGARLAERSWDAVKAMRGGQRATASED